MIIRIVLRVESLLVALSQAIFVRRMLNAQKMLRRRAQKMLVSDRTVKRDWRGKPVVAGWFCVEHKPDADRSTMDRQAEDSVEVRLPTQLLPHACQFVRLVIPRGRSLRGSSDDLSCFFTP